MDSCIGEFPISNDEEMTEGLILMSPTVFDLDEYIYIQTRKNEIKMQEKTRIQRISGNEMSLFFAVPSR